MEIDGVKNREGIFQIMEGKINGEGVGSYSCGSTWNIIGYFVTSV